MISTYQLKAAFQTLLRPVAARLHGAGITANQITVGACAVSLTLGLLALSSMDRKLLFLLISFWCLLRMAANALDGMLAREYGQASRLGAVLNEAGDIVSDIAVYAPFALVPGSHPLWVFAIIALAVVLELLSWRGARGGRARPNHGPMGKSDRALVFGVMALLIGCGVSTVAWINSLWLIVTALLVLTLYNRARYLASTSR